MPSPVPSPLRDATPTRRGLVGITAQTIAGVKTFLEAIKLALKTTGTLPAGGAELEGSILYNTTTKRAMVHDGTAWVPVVMAVGGFDSSSLEEHISSSSAHNATSIVYGEDGNVGDELDDLNANKVGVAALGATGGAALVGAAPGGNLSGTTVQAQLTELDSKKVGSTALASAGGAASVGAVPTGGLTSTTVQAQLAELDTEKVRTDTLITSEGTAMIGGAAKSGMTWFQLAAGTLKAQVEQLLTHVNAVRADQVAPANVSLSSDANHEAAPYGPLTYAKDTGGWGHVLGAITYSGSGTLSGVVGVIPTGCLPTKTVTMKTDAVSYIGGADALNILAYIDTDGNIWVNGVPSGTRIYLSFPAYKCV